MAVVSRVSLSLGLTSQGDFGEDKHVIQQRETVVPMKSGEVGGGQCVGDAAHQGGSRPAMIFPMNLRQNDRTSERTSL